MVNDWESGYVRALCSRIALDLECLSIKEKRRLLDGMDRSSIRDLERGVRSSTGKPISLMVAMDGAMRLGMVVEIHLNGKVLRPVEGGKVDKLVVGGQYEPGSAAHVAREEAKKKTGRWAGGGRAA